jgi:hypothetical protein
MHLELFMEMLPPFREALEIFFLGRLLTELFTGGEFGVDQFDSRVGIGSNKGMLFEKVLGTTGTPGAQIPIELGTGAAQQAFEIVVHVAVGHTRIRSVPKIRKARAGAKSNLEVFTVTGSMAWSNEAAKSGRKNGDRHSIVPSQSPFFRPL